jgi:hypothetical protein
LDLPSKKGSRDASSCAANNTALENESKAGEAIPSVRRQTLTADADIDQGCLARQSFRLLVNGDGEAEILPAADQVWADEQPRPVCSKRHGVCERLRIPAAVCIYDRDANIELDRPVLVKGISCDVTPSAARQVNIRFPLFAIGAGSQWSVAQPVPWPGDKKNPDGRDPGQEGSQRAHDAERG